MRASKNTQATAKSIGLLKKSAKEEEKERGKIPNALIMTLSDASTEKLMFSDGFIPSCIKILRS